MKFFLFNPCLWNIRGHVAENHSKSNLTEWSNVKTWTCCSGVSGLTVDQKEFMWSSLLQIGCYSQFPFKEFWKWQFFRFSWEIFLLGILYLYRKICSGWSKHFLERKKCWKFLIVMHMDFIKCSSKIYSYLEIYFLLEPLWENIHESLFFSLVNFSFN